MKNKIFVRLTLLAVFVGLTSFVSAPAQTSTNAVAAPKPPPMLDNDEMAKLVAVRGQVLGAHPDLKAEEEKLKALHDAMSKKTPTADERNAAFAEWKAYQKTMRAEMLKIDPTLGPIFAKLDAARKNGANSPFSPAK